MIHVTGSDMSNGLDNFWKYIDSQNLHPGVGTEILEVKFVGNVAVKLLPG